MNSQLSFCTFFFQWALGSCSSLFHGNDVAGRGLLSAAGGLLAVPDPTLDPCMIPQGEALRKAPSPQRPLRSLSPHFGTNLDQGMATR